MKYNAYHGILLLLWFRDEDSISRKFVNQSPCARVVFEISTDGEWPNPLWTSDARGALLEQVACVPATQRQENLSVNN